jgi:hypothetical protein
MDPNTGSLDTFVVTLELPTIEPPVLELRLEPKIKELLPELFETLGQYASYSGHRIFIVPGELEREGIVWRFKPEPIPEEVLEIWLSRQGQHIRARVLLKGNAILSLAGKDPLDGDAFGKLAADHTGKAYTDLILPSGDGHKGGDFESWFYLVPG